MTRILRALTIAGAALLMSAQAQADPNVFNFGVYFEPSGIDPHISTDAAATWMANNLYDTLVRYDTTTLDDGTVVGTTEYKPWLAESWEVSDDGSTYVFQIRQGVPFHNGDILTAEDVAFSLERVLTLNFAPAQLLRTCITPDHVSVTGEHEVTVELMTACPFFMSLLVQTPTGAIHNRDYVMANGGVEAETINEHMRTNAMGTGPFTWGEWEPGVIYVLEAFDDHWSGRPHLDRVDFRFISDLASQYVLMQQGSLDAMYNPPIDILEQALENPSLNVLDQQTIGLQTLFMPNKNPPFDDPRVRQAVQLAIDQQEIIDAATLGLAAPARSAFPSLLPGFTDAYWDYDRDVERARALLAEAGHPDGFSTTISYNSGNAQREISAVVAQSQLAEIGIRAEVQAVAWPTFVEGFREGTMPMYVVSGLAAPVPDQFVNDTFTTDAAGPGGNYAYFSDPEVDRLAEELAGTIDTDARMAIMDRIQERLMAELPSAYLYNAVLPYVVRDVIQGWVIYPSGDWFFNTVHKD
jgi:peptide/nickel transport system substrate-binding protein